MRANLSLSGLACIAALVFVDPGIAAAQPGAPALDQSRAGALEQVYYRNRRRGYGHRHYGYGYRPYYRPYGYGYGYGGPYYGYGGYRPYWRPGINLRFGY